MQAARKALSCQPPLPRLLLRAAPAVRSCSTVASSCSHTLRRSSRGRGSCTSSSGALATSLQHAQQLLRVRGLATGRPRGDGGDDASSTDWAAEYGSTLEAGTWNYAQHVSASIQEATRQMSEEAHTLTPKQMAKLGKRVVRGFAQPKIALLCAFLLTACAPTFSFSRPRAQKWPSWRKASSGGGKSCWV